MIGRFRSRLRACDRDRRRRDFRNAKEDISSSSISRPRPIASATESSMDRYRPQYRSLTPTLPLVHCRLEALSNREHIPDNAILLTPQTSSSRSSTISPRQFRFPTDPTHWYPYHSGSHKLQTYPCTFGPKRSHAEISCEISLPHPRRKAPWVDGRRCVSARGREI